MSGFLDNLRGNRHNSGHPPRPIPRRSGRQLHCSNCIETSTVTLTETPSLVNESSTTKSAGGADCSGVESTAAVSGLPMTMSPYRLSIRTKTDAP